MKTLSRLLALGCSLLSLFVQAQPDLPLSRTITAAYEKGTRSPDGRPGPAYWQNAARYDLQIRFEPDTRRLYGTAYITYTNNSPDSLDLLVFKLYPNLYQKGALRDRSVEPGDLTDGVRIQKMTLNGADVPAPDRRIDGTNMLVPIRPLASGQSAQISVDYTYTLNQNSHIRTGEIDSGAWFIAYFFPRIAVYDDIDGWNLFPYTGSQEFYNDICDFNLSVTVPNGYVVWATGDLLNCDEVLGAKYCERLARAEKEDRYAYIIDTLDLSVGSITAPNPENTFRYSALQVPDLAIAVSNHYLWRSSSLVVDPETNRRTRVDAVFNPAHTDYLPVVEDARKTVEAMSFRFPKWPFPYSHITVFDGLDQMEYPMMVNDNPVEDRAESIELTDHEIFHTMFPFYLGINETKYGWMDEGWATIGEWLISPMIDSSIVDEYGMDRYEKFAGTELDLPIMTLSTQQRGMTFFLNSYPKPALGYLYVKDMLGDDAFFEALHHYIRLWHGKHPMPYDFFNAMNAGAEVNLNWFWKRWFFDDGVPDLALGSVKNKGRKKCVTVVRKGEKPVPVDLTVTFTDNSQLRLHRTIAVWQGDAQEVDLHFSTKKTIQNITLGSTYVPDVDKSDNVFPRRQPD